MKYLVVTVALMLTACVPWTESYTRIEREGGTYIHEACHGGVGAPVTVFFPYNGIYLSAVIARSAMDTPGIPGEIMVMVGIHVPEGQKVQLTGKSLQITYFSGNTAVSTLSPLRPTKQDKYYAGAIPYSFNYPDPFGKEDYFGVLTGGTHETRFFLGGAPREAYKWYMFSATIDSNKTEKGSIAFPAMRINGQEVPGPRLPFRKARWFGIMPINC
jgi:hypothetical protein